MIAITKDLAIPRGEIRFRTSRSGGPGGQNVNKLETRVELLFDVRASSSLSEQQKRKILQALGSRIDSSGVLRVASQVSRSQWENKEHAVEKFVRLLRKALEPRKKRIATGRTQASKERRLKEKRRRSEQKRLRKPGADTD